MYLGEVGFYVEAALEWVLPLCRIGQRVMLCEQVQVVFGTAVLFASRLVALASSLKNPVSSD